MGLIDRIKKLGGVLAVAFIVTTYSGICRRLQRGAAPRRACDRNAGGRIGTTTKNRRAGAYIL